MRKKLLISILLASCFYSCKKQEGSEIYYLTNKEKELILYDDSDSFKLKDNQGNYYEFITRRSDFHMADYKPLGLYQYTYESGSVYFQGISGGNVFYGNIDLNTGVDGFQYFIWMSNSKISFKFSYGGNQGFLPMKDTIIVEDFVYNDVYFLENALQFVHLNTEYGFLRIEDIESGLTYTIVRE
jgi:hypothetical protein